MNKIILLTGGGRCGKSSYALQLTERYRDKAFIATAQAFDEEMRCRIAKHKEERSSDFLTVEEPFELARAITELPESIEVCVIDCLTIWLCNLICRDGENRESYQPMEDFLRSLSSPPCNLIIVTNEVGMGIIPPDRLSRVYRDWAGLLNQRVAGLANTVIMMISGLPLVLKGDAG